MATFHTAWLRRVATKEMAVTAIMTLVASCIASWLKQFPVLNLFGALIIALVIGMVIGMILRISSGAGRAACGGLPIGGIKAAAGLISNKLLRLGIILLGFKLNLQMLFTQGLKCLPIAFVVVSVTVVVCYAIARALRVDPMLAILTAGGTGICGAAAVMGLSGSIAVDEERSEEKNDDVTMAVAIVAVMGTVFALIEITLGPLTAMSANQLGLTAGASLHEIAHAVAVGDAVGAVNIATIMKLSRVLMLVIAALAIAVWWDRWHGGTAGRGRRAVVFPWFMLGFIAASIIGTFVPFVGAIALHLVDVAYVVLGMAMAALGMNVNFRAIASQGRMATLASFLTSLLLMCATAGIAVLFF